MNKLSSVKTGISLYATSYGEAPPVPPGLAVLVEKGFISEQSLIDPWGNPLIYKVPGDYGPYGYDLYSLGKDGISRSGGNDPDDINVWDKERSWRYNAYGYATKLFWLQMGLVSLWALSVGAVFVLRRPRLWRLSPHPIALGFVLTIAAATSHIITCLILHRVVNCLILNREFNEWLLLEAVPLTLTLLACVAVTIKTTQLLCTLGIYVGVFAGTVNIQGKEHATDWAGLYLLMPCLFVLLGVCAVAKRRRASAPAGDESG